ncbi:hypothetical protein DRJ17_04555 [Candidatus Woesearchaeota archaeon]|nr:MAG: hypothetical protein DRJ17_04555 [Candidatus Woesearchaeota archaeon]
MEPLKKLVFRLPSEKKCLTFLMENDEIRYASEGRYGGFIFRGSKEELEKAKLIVFSEPSVEEVELNVNEILPADIIDVLGAASEVHKVTYQLVAVKVKVIKETENYLVLDIDSIEDSDTAEAIRVCWAYRGSRRYPRGSEAGRQLARIKVRLIKHDLQDNFYAKTAEDCGRETDYRDSTLYFKKIIKTPNFKIKEAGEKAITLTFTIKSLSDIEEAIKQLEELKTKFT